MAGRYVHGTTLGGVGRANGDPARARAGLLRSSAFGTRGPLSLLVASLAAVCGGCGASAANDWPGVFRQEALPREAFLLDCAPAEVVIEPLAERTVGVRGCGRSRVYLRSRWGGWVDDTIAMATERQPRVRGGAAFLIGTPSFATDGVPRAAFEMSCPRGLLTVVPLGGDEVAVTGCGEKALYAAELWDRRTRLWRPLLLEAE